MESTTHSGIVPRILARLFGERAARLTEHASRAHWLSYLLVLSQSIAVVLVLGHAQLPLLFSASWAIRALAAMGLFVLVATVFASDLALLETLRRIPVLARNRQRVQLREHVLYVAFVLLVEASTYAVVMAALDRNPQALITAQPLIPAEGPVFWLQVILRAVLVVWTAVQLVIVRGKLPVLLSTLTNTGKEIVGAHVERQLAGLDIAGVTLPDTFRTYAAMARPPRRVRTMLNGWLCDRELAAEAEEERQVSNVVTALEDLERRRARAVNMPEAPAVRADGEDNTRPPTGPGTPVAAPAVRTRQRKAPAVLKLETPPEWRKVAAQASAKGTNGRRVRTRIPIANYEPQARAAWAEGARSIPKMERATGMSHSAAQSWVRTLKAESAAIAANTGIAEAIDGQAQAAQ